MNLQAVIWKEEDMYIIKETHTGVTTQGSTIEMATENIKEAVRLYLEEVPDAKNVIKDMDVIGTINVKIS